MAKLNAVRRARKIILHQSYKINR